jgi:iron complex transport system substrate-binding protein
LKSGVKSAILVVIMAVLLISVSYVALTAPEEQRTEYPLPITDALGRQVTFEEVPERIISATPGNTEMIFALGLEDKLVGITDWCNWPTKVLEMKENGTVSSIGGYWDPSLEIIINLEPDLVVLSGGVFEHTQIAEQLEDAGVTAFVAWKGANITEIYQNIEVLGEICDRNEAASELIQSMTERIDYVKSVIAGQDPISILHAVWLEPVYTCGGATFVSEVIEMAGGENIFGELDGWPTVSIEEVISRQPQVMTLTATMMMNTPEEIIEMLENDSLWSQVPAVQNGKVYILQYGAEDIINRESVRIVDAIELLAKILYPDAFGITVPNVIGNDYQDYLSSQALGSLASALEGQGNVVYV